MTLSNRTHPSLFYILTGFRLLAKPGIRKFVIIPLCINFLLFGALLMLAEHYFHQLDIWVSQLLPAWLSWLATLLWIIFFLAFFTFFIFTFTALGNIISAPFNSFLAEKVERYLTGKAPEPRTFSENFHDVPRMIGRQLGILAYFLPRALGVLLLFVLPFVHVFATFIWIMFNAWFMALQYLDYPADNHRVPLKELHKKLKANRWESLGFGGGILIFSLVPVLNFIVMPAAVAGATQMWVERFSTQPRP